MTRITTFEATYPRYEFSTLVELGIALAAALKRTFGRTGDHRAADDHGAAAGDHLGHAA